MRPARGLVHVRPVQTEERFPGRKIVLLESTRERLTAQQAEVLDVGFDELCEDDDCPREHVTTYSGDKVHDSDVYVGDWIIVEPRVSFELEDGTRFVRQAHVVARILTEP